MKVEVLVVLAFAALASPAAAQNNYIKSMAHALHGPDDVTPCHDKLSPAETRITFCRAAIKDGNFDLYLDLARLQRVEGQYDDALASIATLTKRMPEVLDHPWTQSDDWVPILVERSIIYALMGRFDDAVKDADTIDRITVNGAVGLNAQCLIRGVAGKELEQGLDDCNRSLERKPRVAETRELRAMIYFKLGRFPEALADFDEALDRKPDLDGSRFARGVVKLRLGDAKGGNEDIAEARTRSASIAQNLAGYGIAP